MLTPTDQFSIGVKADIRNKGTTKPITPGVMMK